MGGDPGGACAPPTTPRVRHGAGHARRPRLGGVRAGRTAPPTGPVRVTGWLQPGEGSGGADPDPTDDVIPQLRVADAIQHVARTCTAAT